MRKFIKKVRWSILVISFLVVGIKMKDSSVSDLSSYKSVEVLTQVEATAVFRCMVLDVDYYCAAKCTGCGAILIQAPGTKVKGRPYADDFVCSCGHRSCTPYYNDLVNE